MPNDLFTNDNPFARLTTVRAEQVNAKFAAVEAAFDLVTPSTEVTSGLATTLASAKTYTDNTTMPLATVTTKFAEVAASLADRKTIAETNADLATNLSSAKTYTDNTTMPLATVTTKFAEVAASLADRKTIAQTNVDLATNLASAKDYTDSAGVSLRQYVDVTAFQTALPQGGVAGQYPTPDGNGGYVWATAAEPTGNFENQPVQQLRNTDDTTDINTATWTQVPIGGTVDLSDDDFTTVATHTVRANFDGRVHITAHLSQSTNGLESNNRQSVAVRVTKNGAQVGPVGRHSYIRNSNGQDESASSTSTFADVSDGDIIAVQSFNEGEVGTAVTQVAGDSMLAVMRVGGIPGPKGEKGILEVDQDVVQTVIEAIPLRPLIKPVSMTAPLEGATDVGDGGSYTFATSGFGALYGATLASVTVRFYDPSAPSVIIESVTQAGSSSAVLVALNSTSLVTSTTYLVDMRFTSSLGDTADTDKVSFTTAAQFMPSIGQAYEGGFFAGQLTDDILYNIVVAPKAGGHFLQKWTNGTGLLGVTNRRDGPANTTAIVGSGTAIAAATCQNLVLGGYDDWFLPSMDELGLAYKGLKPSTTVNLLGTRSSPYAGDYGENASITDNQPHTANNPSQTAIAAFQAGGSEAFESGLYYTSSEVNATTALAQGFNDGQQLAAHKESSGVRVRAFRRVAA